MRLTRRERWSRRRIARELGVDRETVGKYLRERLEGPKPANAPTGSGGSKPATFPGVPAPTPKPANAPTGSTADGSTQLATDPPLPEQPVSVVAGPERPGSDDDTVIQVGPLSQCAPYRERIAELMKQGLSARRIQQDLWAEAN